MRKTIKVEDRVYDKLTSLMAPKESYSEVIERVLTLFDKMGELRSILEGAVAFREGQRERLEKLAEANR